MKFISQMVKPFPLGNVCIQYSILTLTAVLGHQSTNNKLIKRFSNYRYMYTIFYGVDMMLRKF